MTATRLFFASDIHGSEVCFRKLLSAAKVYKAEVIVCGGDVTGKFLVPIARRADGRYRCIHAGSEVVVETRADAEEVAQRIRNSGSYPVFVQEGEAAEWDREEIARRFRVEMSSVLSRWLDMAEDRLSPLGVTFVMIPGNDDEQFVTDLLDDSGFVLNADGRVIDTPVGEIVGLGNANETPWQCPRDVPEGELEAMLLAAAGRVSAMDRCIFDVHVPPFDSRLDTAPQLDKTFKPVTDGGQIRMIPVGSTAVRKVIESHQPRLGLHGHIHESRGVSKIGRTVCMNPGSDYQIGILKGALVAFNGRKDVQWSLTAG